MNLLVLISHDLGQHLGCYGVEGLRTQNLDGFASQGVRFANSFCTAPQCSPSRAALWTGRFAHANGVIGLAHWSFANDLNPNERHLAQILRERGYGTHLFGAQHVSPKAERLGFEYLHGVAGVPCNQVAQAAASFLPGMKDPRPFFMQISFHEPHRPFVHEGVDLLPEGSVKVLPYLPDIPDVREDLLALEASCCSVDRAFAVIMDALRLSGREDDTIVVYTTDHGIAFPHAKMTLYDPGIQTALLMRVPGAKGGKVHHQMISNVDLLPTFLELLGEGLPDNLHGRSFKGLLTGGDYKPNDAVFAEKTYHSYYDPMRCIRTERWKLIANFEFAPQQETSALYNHDSKSYAEILRAQPLNPMYHPPFELYDLQIDPLESHNLADKPEHAGRRDELARRLRQWMIDTEDPLLDGPIAQGAYRRRMKEFLAK